MGSSSSYVTKDGKYYNPSTNKYDASAPAASPSSSKSSSSGSSSSNNAPTSNNGMVSNVVYNSDNKPYAYMVNGSKIIIGSASDTPENQAKANISITKNTSSGSSSSNNAPASKPLTPAAPQLNNTGRENYYVELNDNGSVNDTLLVQNKDKSFSPATNTYVDANGNQVTETYTINSAIKKSVEGGAYNPIDASVRQSRSSGGSGSALPDYDKNFGLGGGGTLTPAEKPSMLEKAKAQLNPLWEGFTFQSSADYVGREFNTRPVGEQVLYGAGLVGGIATLGFSGELYGAAKAAPVVAGSIAKADAVLNVARSTKVGAYAVDLGLGTAKTIAATDAASYVLARTDGGVNVDRSLISVGGADVGSARAAGRAAEVAAISGEGGGFGVPFTGKSLNLHYIANQVFPLFAGNQDAYAGAAYNDFIRQGLNPMEAQAATRVALYERKTNAIAEVGGLLYISKQSEALGRKYVAEKFAANAAGGAANIVEKKSFGPLFKAVAPQIAKAGAFEGLNTAIVQNNLRAEDLSVKEAAGYTIFGAVTAGLIGGTIVGTGLVKPKVSKTLEVASYLSDPYEFAGDKLQDFSEFTGKKVLGRSYPEPRLVRVNADLVNFGGGRPKVNSFTDVFAPVSSNVNSDVNSNVNVRSNVNVNMESVVNSKVNANSNVNVFADVFTNVNVKTHVPVNVNPFIDTPINPDVPVDVPVNVPVNVPVDVPVNVMTPFPRLPPILPLEVPKGFGGTGFGGRGGKKYVNEIAVSSALLNDLIGGTGFNNVSQAFKRPKKSKRGRR